MNDTNMPALAAAAPPEAGAGGPRAAAAALSAAAATASPNQCLVINRSTYLPVYVYI